MACNAADIPKLEFPRDEIIEIIPSSYNNQAKRIHISGLSENIVPGSPEDIRIPVPPSGAVSPFSGLGTPRVSSGGTATPKEVELVKEEENKALRELQSGRGTPPPPPPIQPLKVKDTHVDPSS